MQQTANELNPALLRQCRLSFDWWQRFASGRAGGWVMFGWACAEAIFWPVIPDFLLVPMAAANRRRFYVSLLASIAGSALGGSFLFGLASFYPALAGSFLGHLPLVYPWQVAEVSQELASQGTGAFVSQPWTGISFKVWAVAGGTQGLHPWLVIPLFIAARAFRMAVFATAARLLAGWQSRFVRDFWLYLVAAYLVLFFYEWWQIVGQ